MEESHRLTHSQSPYRPKSQSSLTPPFSRYTSYVAGGVLGGAVIGGVLASVSPDAYIVKQEMASIRVKRVKYQSPKPNNHFPFIRLSIATQRPNMNNEALYYINDEQGDMILKSFQCSRQTKDHYLEQSFHFNLQNGATEIVHFKPVLSQDAASSMDPYELSLRELHTSKPYMKIHTPTLGHKKIPITLRYNQEKNEITSLVLHEQLEHYKIQAEKLNYLFSNSGSAKNIELIHPIPANASHSFFSQKNPATAQFDKMMAQADKTLAKAEEQLNRMTQNLSHFFENMPYKNLDPLFAHEKHKSPVLIYKPFPKILFGLGVGALLGGFLGGLYYNTQSNASSS